MNTRTTFEDRLLNELQREIELREAGPGELGAGETRLGAVGPRLGEVVPSEAPARVRGLVTRPRIALASGACAAAALAVVLVPGSPADSTAYAVESHDDGSVSLTLNDLSPGRGAQRELADRLRENGIHVDIQDLDDTHTCEQPRGQSIPGNFDIRGATEGGAHIKEGEPEAGARAASHLDAWKITLHPGDTLAFENHEYDAPKGSMVLAANFYAVKGTIKPCVPVETAKPVLEGVDVHSSATPPGQ
ncbi:hypothetical protein ACFWP7_39975 [Streptomyces sp. NPDC058470]|uniref:hypothetical protein n=1 Tax=Streptomyces sp. NPDC058470 TaxID=3346515 RepID=UPI0036660DD2